jgi:NADPH:quinone reductase-like Zn-dependent oxidoreductase
MKLVRPFVSSSAHSTSSMCAICSSRACAASSANVTFGAVAEYPFGRMRAVVIRETGGPEVLQVEEVPDPVPGDGEVIVRITAAGVNRFDLNQRAGGATSFPLILGADGAGIREDTGERVLIAGGAANHTYAELAAIREDRVWPLPEAVGDAAGAALGTPYRTAWLALVGVAGLKQGDTLLVQAGSSATGQAAVDVGRAVGATVYATASSAKLGRLREVGAEALAYDDERLSELGANVVFDPVGDTIATSVAALAPHGIVVTPGAVGSPQLSLNVWSLVGKRGRIEGIAGQDAGPEVTQRIIELAAEGKLRPVIDRELALERAAEAHRAIEARETFGKVVLRP